MLNDRGEANTVCTALNYRAQFKSCASVSSSHSHTYTQYAYSRGLRFEELDAVAIVDEIDAWNDDIFSSVERLLL